MSKKMKEFALFLTLFINTSTGVIYPSIPEHLLECYRGGGPDLGAPKRLDVLLSLVRKLEQNSQLDLRLFSASLLRSLRLDGVEEAENPVETEFVTPYRASAFQFHKYKLLIDLFLPSRNFLEVDEYMSLVEKCLLHRMLSSTIRSWERGDENVCPITIEQRQNVINEGFNQSRLHSRCPIEEGVMQTEWGTVAPGTVIAAIASALEPQRVPVTAILNTDVFKADVAEPLIASAKEEWFMDIETLQDNVNRLSQTDSIDISNIWVATLAGDLAEVAVNQGPRVGSAPQRMTIGSNNRWNDTLLPRHYYLLPQNGTFIDWHFTDAEILGGIDGLILASYVPTWVEQRRSLRLSQIIEMYYSSEGVSFDSSVKACNRQTLFMKTFDDSQLLRETSRFAHVLSLLQGSVYMPLEEMDRISKAAVTAFSTYVQTVISQNHKECRQISINVPEVNLIVATDGSWRKYDVEQFLSWLGGVVELDVQRGSLALLHGNTGRWISPPANNLTGLFTNINNFTDEWPNRLNLPNVISTIIQYSQNETLDNIEKKVSVAPNTVVLIVSPSDRLSTNDLERARELMKTLRATHFDVYFAYASQDLTAFRNINNEYMDYSEVFLMSDSTSVQDVIKTVKANLVESDIPIKIFGSHCPVNDTVYDQTPYEDFVLPGRIRPYRIHPFYLRQQALISVQFRNDGHGQLLVCTWRGADASRSCQTINERDNYIFNITTPCPSPDFCPPAHYAVSVVFTQNLCANNDCRLPHQVGYYIQHTGLRCISLRNSAVNIKPTSIFLIIFTIICFYFISDNNQK